MLRPATAKTVLTMVTTGTVLRMRDVVPDDEVIGANRVVVITRRRWWVEPSEPDMACVEGCEELAVTAACYLGKSTSLPP